MGKSKRKGPHVTYKGFFHLPHKLMANPDFVALSGSALKLLIDLGSQYNGHNNGDLCAAMTLMKERGWTSNSLLTKAIRELLASNWIEQTRQGGLRMGPTLYAITWQPIHECGGKLDVKPTTSPSRAI